MQILTVFWGEKHTEWFKKGLVHTFKWDKNFEAIKGATWNIWCDKPEEIHEIVQGQFPDVKVNVISTDNLRRYTDPIQNALVIQIERCLKTGEQMLLAPPDTIFGNGSIAAMIKSGYQKGTAVVVPHPRVLPTIIDKPYMCGSNAHLVDLAWKHLHKSWVNAERGHPQQSSFIGGVTWQRLADNIISVTHLLPTVYLVDFLPEDLEYFKQATSFGDWDHTWSMMLLEKQRERYIASSDAAFICELTEADKNVPPWHHEHPTDGSFWKNFPHNKINKGILATFRLKD